MTEDGAWHLSLCSRPDRHSLHGPRGSRRYDGNSYALESPAYVDSFDETRAFTEAAEQYFTEGSIHNIHLE